MKRILFIDQYGGIGGGQRVLMALLRVAIAAGYQVTVLAPGDGPLQAGVKEAFGSTVAYVPCEELRLTHGRKGIGDVLALATYGWRFRRYRPLLACQDVIHVNGLRHLPHLLLLTRGLHAALIYHIHLVHSRPERLLLRLAAKARNTFRLVAVSSFVRDTLGFSSPRIALIENALDDAFARLPFRDRFGEPGPWRAAVVGTLRPEKGQDVAVAAIGNRANWSLTLIGGEGDNVAVWTEALRRESGPQVQFTGSVRDVIRELEKRNVQFSLVPSQREESFGLAAIESMACSCLTIVSGHGGLAEIAARTGAPVADGAVALSSLLEDLVRRPPEDLASLARSQHAATLAAYAPQRFEAEIRALLASAFAERQRRL